MYARDSAQRFYRPELDALRLFAFAAVFTHHWLPHDPGAYPAWVPVVVARFVATTAWGLGFAVDLFFALSSYLITELLIREHARRGRIDVPAFYVRRALRIWPLYFAFIAFAVIVLRRFMAHEHIGGPQLLASLLFLGNWTTAFLGFPASVTALLWSVSIEEQFYVCWPLLLRRFGPQSIVRIAVVMFVAAFLGRWLFVLRHSAHSMVWTSTITHLDPFAAGCVLAVALRGERPTLAGWQTGGLLAFGLAVWPLVGLLNGYSGRNALVAYPLVTIGSVCLIVACLAHGARTRSRSVLTTPAILYGGRISYGLYVFHSLALTVAEAAIPRAGGAELVPRGAIGATLTLTLAAISYRVLESPFLRLKARFTYVRSRPVTGPGSTCEA